MTVTGRTARTAMKIKLLAIAVILLASAPSFAAHRHFWHHHHHHWHTGWSHHIYLHNYGPPDFYPGTTAWPDRVVVPARGLPYGIYDGHVRFCGQSSASYTGQDGRRHPCN
jgi:hypothetical protein